MAKAKRSYFKRNLKRVSRFLHKWVALIAGLQVLLWITGGMIFTNIPHKGVVKGENYMNKRQDVDLNNLYSLESILPRMNGNAKSLKLVNVNGLDYYKITDTENNIYMFNAHNGIKISKPKEEDIKSYAKNIYKGDKNINKVELLSTSEVKKRLIIVDETHGKRDLWMVQFDDLLSTRLYFLEDTGEFYKAKNNTYVLYNFFWRIHLMDYKKGKNFDHWLIKITSIMAFIIAISGMILLILGFMKSNKVKKI